MEKDEIIINLKALTVRQREKLGNILNEALNDVDCETNSTALEDLDQFEVY